MLLDDVVTDAQTEAGSFPWLFGREKRHTDLVEVFFWDANSVVRDFKPDEWSAPDDHFLGSESHGLVFVPVWVSLVQGMPGIRQQIDENLLDLVIARLKWREGFINLFVDSYMIQLDLVAREVQREAS